MKPATPLPWDYANIENAIIPGAVLVDSDGDCICRVPLEKGFIYITPSLIINGISHS